MVHTFIDAQAREAHSAGTLRRYGPRTLYAGRIPPHVEQSCVELIAVYAVQTWFSVTRETRGSRPPSSHRDRQSHRRDDDVGPQRMAEPPSSDGPTRGNGGFA